MNRLHHRPVLSDPSVVYYRQNANAYFEGTRDVDMTAFHERFLRLLPHKAEILDAGCGSGRDSRAFLDLGHQVIAFDASPELAALAEKVTGEPVQVMRFDEVGWVDRFDGIWACASLLHVPIVDLPGILRLFHRALKTDGILYASFKYGTNDRVVGGRRFTDMDEDRLAQVLDQTSPFTATDIWVTHDVRPGRDGERWLNVLLRAQ